MWGRMANVTVWQSCARMKSTSTHEEAYPCNIEASICTGNICLYIMESKAVRSFEVELSLSTLETDDLILDKGHNEQRCQSSR